MDGHASALPIDSVIRKDKFPVREDAFLVYPFTRRPFVARNLSSGILQCRDEHAPRLKANLGLRLAWRRPHARQTIPFARSALHRLTPPSRSGSISPPGLTDRCKADRPTSTQTQASSSYPPHEDDPRPIFCGLPTPDIIRNRALLWREKSAPGQARSATQG